ncbi:hypothetical protein SAMN05192533_10526 [Mesobacillus persicus]|uniref:Uncharacterized protein n=1 Tax=Mesobacillus persicus TaxID=930146 RepID=A0A1H8AIX8_9BACI|nr:hypothetical protein SAMN05192533_10526 [Mesobacillus persicus]
MGTAITKVIKCVKRKEDEAIAVSSFLLVIYSVPIQVEEF